MKHLPLVWSGLLLASPSALHAGCCEHQTPSETFQSARAAGEYRVLSCEPFRGDDGTIRTRYRLSLNQALKGEAPGELEVDYQGGRLADEMAQSSLNPDWNAGEDYILHLEQAKDGQWQPAPFRSRRNAGTLAQKKALRDFVRNGANGPAPREPQPREGSGQGNSGVPSSRITTTGYFETSGVPCRFTTDTNSTMAGIPAAVGVPALRAAANVVPCAGIRSPPCGPGSPPGRAPTTHGA